MVLYLSKIYDKRDDVDFDIVNCPFLGEDSPHATSYTVYIITEPTMWRVVLYYACQWTIDRWIVLDMNRYYTMAWYPANVLFGTSRRQPADD